jgi:hypothetical protein
MKREHNVHCEAVLGQVIGGLLITRKFVACERATHFSIYDNDDMPTETPAKLIEAMKMLRRFHLLTVPQQPQL